MIKRARPKSHPPVERAAWPLREGCYKLGISRTSAYQMNKLGKLNFVKFGGRTLIPDSEIKRLTTVAS
jgi:predicted site-specific integrase-resolvase